MAMADFNMATTEKDLIGQSNPEAMLDVLTIRSMRSRYIDHDGISVASEPLISLDRDLDTFVRDFQINDSISDIFLMEDEPKKPKAKQTVSGSTHSSKNSKKSGRRAQSVDDILEARDDPNIHSKKPKTFSSLFSRKVKPKSDSRKGKAVTWQPQFNDVVLSPKKNKQKGDNSVKPEETEGGYMTMNKTPVSGVVTKPFNIMRDKTRDVGGNSQRISQDLDGEYAVLHSVCSDNTKFDQLISHIESGNTEELIHDLSTLSPDFVSTLCDNRGNNVLHKCVMKNKPSLLATTVSIQPHLADVVNREEITPMELAVKLGRTACLKTFLQRCLTPDSETNLETVSSLLSYGIQCRQEKSVGIVFEHLRLMTSGSLLPPPARGKRAPPSHVAAARDDIHSLQRLVELGCDVTQAENGQEVDPVDVAYNKGNMSCFRYLLLVHSLQSVLGETLKMVSRQQSDQLIIHKLHEKLKVLQTASRQYESLLERQRDVSGRCVQIVDGMLEDKENGHSSKQLDELRHHLTSMNTFRPDVALSRHIEEAVALSQRCGQGIPPSPNHLQQKANQTSRTLLKEIHESWHKEDFSMDEFVKETLFGQTEGLQKGNGHNPESRSELSTSRTRTFCVNDNIARSVPPTQRNESESARDYKQSQVPERDFSHSSTHPFLHRKVSHEYASIDKDTIERGKSFAWQFHDKNESSNEKEAKKAPLVPQKSPDYATILSETGGSTLSGQFRLGDIDEVSELSDDTMSTISSHNSTLQSAVGHVIRESFSETDSCESERAYGRPRDNREHSIGQFDVSDFSTDASSDWLSSSCFSQMTNSQMTSYYSDDETETYNCVRLNLENEDLPDELLRNHRLCRHLEAVKKLNTENDDVIETVVTATGERISSSASEDEEQFINVSNVTPETKSEQPTKQESGKKRKKPKLKLFDPGELVSKRELSQSEFIERYDRTADVSHTQRCHDDLNVPWDQLQFSDIEEETPRHKPWYDVSEDEESLAHAWSSDSEASTLCDSSPE